MSRAAARRWLSLVVVPAAVVAGAGAACAGRSETGAGDPPSSAVAAGDAGPGGSTPSDAQPADGAPTTAGSLTGPPSTAASASASAGPADGARCRAAALGLELGDEGSGAGHHYQRLVFTNNGTQPCTITGFPGVSYLGAGDRQIGTPAERERAVAVTVTLAAGASASALIDERSAGGFPPDQCGGPEPVVGLRVYLPDDTDPVRVPAAGDACPDAVGQLSVRPVQAGRDSQP
jgi:hypothetical protein